MKYENLIDIPWGYEMQLVEDYGDYPKGTKILRGNLNARLDDNVGVSFTFPNGEWDYFDKQQIEDLPQEYKGMKGSDKVMIELTGYQLAKLYAIMGHTNGYDLSDSWLKFQEILGDSTQEIHDKYFHGKKYEDVRNYANYCREWEAAILEPETPILTEAQKKALELKETISKAQKQLEELEKELK